MTKKKGFKKRAKKSQPKAIKPISTPTQIEKAQTAPVPTVAKTADPKTTYIKQDLKRITILVSGFILGQLVLWYVLSSTPAGDAVYNLIKI